MANMTDNKNMGHKIKRSNIYIIRVPKQMNGGNQ